MKRRIIGIVLVLSVFNLYATEIRTVNTSYENSLLDAAGYTSHSKITEEDWYFSKDGIDKTAQKMVENLSSKEDSILYGISLGGTVARRVTQIAAENGKKVKGYIAQSSPLYGDRLVNKTWATTALGLLAGYTYVGSFFVKMNLDSLLLGYILSGDIFKDEFKFIDDPYDDSSSLLNCVRNINVKEIDRNDSESVITNITLPLIDAVMGNDNNSRITRNYFKAVFIDKTSNVKDLNPKSSFMEKMNSPQEVAKETESSIKRAFIISENGNIYDTSIWPNVETVLNYYKTSRNVYLIKWFKPQYLLKAASIEITIGVIEGVPKVWSTCVSGSPDYSTNDGFVPVKDNFFGSTLKMSAKSRSTDYDREYECSATSHIDYSEKSIEKLENQTGRYGSRSESSKQQKDALKAAMKFMGK